MMYRMKNIITYDDDITLPKCMYYIKNPNQVMLSDYKNADDINISNQSPNKKMTDLEERQDQLLKKLDILYDRIKTIRCSISSASAPQKETKNHDTKQLSTPDEIVVAVSSDNLPYFLNLFAKNSTEKVNISWHIHSSVPNDKVPKINDFIKKLKKNTETEGKVNLRLIFRHGSADSELKLSSLSVPILGNVNILRYLSYVYPNILPYDQDDYCMDSLLDLCHQLEITPEKNRDAVINKLFSQYKNWIYKNQFSIVDLAVYNIVKQWQNSSKHVPKDWLNQCENKCA